MASLYDLKPAFRARLMPLAARLAGAGVSANQVTAAALALCALHGIWLMSGPGPAALLALPLTLGLRMALNALDGVLAREHGQASRFGALFNELADLAGDALLYLPLALAPGMPAALAVAAVVAGLLAEVAGQLAPMVGAARRYDGPFGKSDRAAFFGLLALLLGAGLAPGGWAGPALALGCALSALTLANRVRGALRAGGDG